MKDNIINLINRLPDKPASYILHGRDGDLLIDTGYLLCRNAVEEFTRKYNVRWIFLTHGHFDHAYNAKYLKDKYGYKIILHEKDKDLYENKYVKMNPTRKRYKFKTRIADKLAKLIKQPVSEIDYYLNDQDTDFLRKLGFDADVIMLPGHTYGSMGIKTADVLYVGDACSSVKAHYKTVYLGADVKKLKETEKIIRKMQLKYICPGHGSPIHFSDK